MRFTDDEIDYLVNCRTGGPCLEIEAFFSEPPTALDVALLLGQSATVFGPCEDEDGSFAEDLRRGHPSGRITTPPEEGSVQSCRFVLEIGHWRVSTFACEFPDFDVPSFEAWVYPSTVCRALRKGDWYAEHGEFGWDALPAKGRAEETKYLVPLYWALARWWASLGALTTLRGMHIGYETSDVTELAVANPDHMVVQSEIAQAMGLSARPGKPYTIDLTELRG